MVRLQNRLVSKHIQKMGPSCLHSPFPVKSKVNATEREQEKFITASGNLISSEKGRAGEGEGTWVHYLKVDSYLPSCFTRLLRSFPAQAPPRTMSAGDPNLSKGNTRSV